MCWQVALYLKREEKKSLIVLCQMIATWSPNLLFLIVFLTSVNTGTSLSLSPLVFLVQCLLPRCWPPSHPGPPSNSSFFELNSESTTVSPYPLLDLQTRYFCCDFFSNASPRKVSCHFGKLDQIPTWGLYIKPQTHLFLCGGASLWSSHSHP